MRSPKPWFRVQTDTWYVCLRGKQIPLAKGKRSKRAAEDAFHRLVYGAEHAAPTPVQTHASGPTDGSTILIAVLTDEFLDWVQLNLKCYDWCRQFLQQFVTECGTLSVGELKPFHVTRWLASKPTWGPSTRCRVIGLLKQLFNWGIEQGLISVNPLRTLKKPKANRRERILTAAEREKIFEAAGHGSFRNFLTAMAETGARPGEIRILSAASPAFCTFGSITIKSRSESSVASPRA